MSKGVSADATTEPQDDEQRCSSNSDGRAHESIPPTEHTQRNVRIPARFTPRGLNLAEGTRERNAHKYSLHGPEPPLTPRHSRHGTTCPTPIPTLWHPRRSTSAPYRPRPRRRKRQPAKIKSLQRHRTMATTQRGNIPPRKVRKARRASWPLVRRRAQRSRWSRGATRSNRTIESLPFPHQLPQIASLCGRTRGRHEDTKSHRIDTMLTKFDQNTTNTCVV